MTELKKSLLILIGLICLATACLAGVVYSNKLTSTENTELEQTPQVRSLYVNGNTNEKTTIDVVEVDGVEYLIAHTPRGISICKK